MVKEDSNGHYVINIQFTEGIHGLGFARYGGKTIPQFGKKIRKITRVMCTICTFRSAYYI